MTIDALRAFFGWCSVINVALLLFSFIMLTALRPLVYRVHGKMFNLSKETIDSSLYTWIGYYKIAIFMFNIAPYFALRIIG